ncbi:MAG: signal recognition particle-docking protein FtsY [Woeseiaceae bacterium]|nr:signal recognition particle-docking protein FtsY [Woeseiaceae bacterium]
MSDKESKSISFFSRLKNTLAGTKASVTDNFFNFLGKTSIDDDLIEDIEAHLIMSDVGIETTDIIIKQLKNETKKKISEIKDLKNALKNIMLTILEPVDIRLTIASEDKPFVILMVGVNGAGKTTSIGKLSRSFISNNNSVLLAAGDTFRAAAVEQLESWANRNNIDVVSQVSGADPAAVCYDAYDSAKAKNIDILMVDTAGRLHTQKGLMDELVKIKNTLNKHSFDAPHEILLVLDASLGQNALIQAERFNETLGVTGLIITKLDGSAKGGILLGIANQLNIPIRYIGIGEKAEDMKTFDRFEYVDALLDYPNPNERN